MKYLVLLTLMTLVACNLVPPSRRPAQYKETDKSIALLRIPPKTINRELSNLVKTSDIIKSISPLAMDPVTRIISLRMTLKYPLNSLYDYEQKPKSRVSEEQEIEMAFSLPELVMSRYLSITFHKFKINGDDYLNAFSVVGSVVQTVLANSNLINYVFNQAGSSITDYRTMMAEIIEDNGILVNQTMRNIKFKLNLKYFDQLADFSDYKDLRVWAMEPTLFQDRDVFFKLEAGFGKPSKKWKEEYFTERNEDISKILKIRNKLYEEYSDIISVKTILTSYLDKILGKESIRYSKLDQVYKNEVDRLKGSFDSQARSILTKSNPTFEADPEEEYISFLSSQKEKIKNFVSDLDRRLTIDHHILARGSSANKKPLLTKRIGLDVLNASMNFLRDYEYEGQKFVKEAYVSIAPQVPGLIARGKVHIDLNYFLGMFETGLLLDDKFVSKIPETKTGIPFELVLETKFEDNSVLGLDAKSITLFSGDKKLHFTRNSKNHDFMLDFLKIYLVQSMAGIEFEMGGESTLSAEDKEKKRIKELLEYLKALKTAYGSNADDGILKNILKVMNVDMDKNPHASAGEDYIKNKSKILFGDVIEYDSKTGLFKMKLNPKIAMDNIMGAENTLQVWNIAPLYSKEFNNTFLEIAVGNGQRSKTYVEQTFDLRNDLDNANFVGIYNDNNRSTIDLLASLNFNYVEAYANNLFKEIIKKKNGDYQKQLAIDEEQTHYILDHLKLDVKDNKKLSIDLNASVLSKKKGGLFGWGKWKTDKKSYAISAEIELESKALKDVKNQLRSHKVPIYLADQVIGVKINRVKLKFGKPSLVNKALNKLTNLNLQSSIGSKFRGLLLSIVNKYFQSSWKKKDKNNMYGDSLEEMVRVFTTKSQIMLMLNPRMSGAAFELKLSGEEENFATKAIKIDSTNQEMHIAFTAATAMAKMDRRELMNIVNDTNQLFYKYLNIKNKNTFIKKINDMQLVNQSIRDSDDEKMSLYNRLIKVMRNYDQVLNVANIPFPAKNADRRITACGSELLYFSATSYILYNRLYKLTKKIQDWKLQEKVKYYKTMVEARKKLYSNIFKPLMLKYRSDFHNRNMDILAAPYSYWTHNFYPDAFFTEAIYKELLKEGI